MFIGYVMYSQSVWKHVRISNSFYIVAIFVIVFKGCRAYFVVLIALQIVKPLSFNFENNHHWKFGEEKCHITLLKEAKGTQYLHWGLRRIEKCYFSCKRYKGLMIMWLLITIDKRHCRDYGHAEGRHGYHPLVSYWLYVLLLQVAFVNVYMLNLE